MDPFLNRAKAVPATLLMVAALACTHYKPGMDPRGKSIKQQCSPIILAIEQYKAVNGVFPTSLAQLVPNYLPVTPSLNFTVTLVKGKAGTTLMVNYEPTWPNTNLCSCTYFFSDSEWHCVGYY